MGIRLVRVDNGRVSAGCAAALKRMDKAFYAKFRMHLRVTSGHRTKAEQERIFRQRFRVQGSGGGPFGDVRHWKGKRWVRHSAAGTVAVPGTSRHEKAGAVDLRDTGKNAGVTVAGTARAKWLRKNGPKYGFQPTGHGFGEPWHYDYNGPHSGPAPAPAKNPTPKPKAKPKAEPKPTKTPAKKPTPAPVPKPETKDRPIRDSMIRTFTPWIVGAVIGWFVSLGWDISETWHTVITIVASLLVGIAYYAIVRFLETKVAPKFGWLLGMAKNPNYRKPR